MSKYCNHLFLSKQSVQCMPLTKYALDSFYFSELDYCAV